MVSLSSFSLITVPEDPLIVKVESVSPPVVGEEFHLTCEASKTTHRLTNRTTASWSHDLSNDVITEGQQIYDSIWTTSRDLSIPELRTSHGGDYWCEGQLVSPAADQPLVKRERYRLELTSELGRGTTICNMRVGSTAVRYSALHIETATCLF